MTKATAGAGGHRKHGKRSTAVAAVGVAQSAAACARGHSWGHENGLRTRGVNSSRRCGTPQPSASPANRSAQLPPLCLQRYPDITCDGMGGEPRPRLNESLRTAPVARSAPATERLAPAAPTYDARAPAAAAHASAPPLACREPRAPRSSTSRARANSTSPRQYLQPPYFCPSTRSRRQAAAAGTTLVGRPRRPHPCRLTSTATAPAG
jgi:hypothetical protein